MESKRKNYIDIIKIFAIFMVLFNHSGASGFLAYQNTGNIFIQVLQLIPSILCKVAVPLFFMCSGALLLLKEETMENLWKKRVLKYVIVTVLFTFLYYVFLSVRDGGTLDLIWFVRTVYSTSTFSYSGAYWFLYSYIGFLIMLPLLRIIAKNLDDKLIIYILVINVFVRGILPMAEIVLGMGHLAVDTVLITSDVFFYTLLGAYIERCDFEKIASKKNLSVLFVGVAVAFATSAIITILYFYKGKPTEEYLGLFGMFTVMFIYIWAKKTFEKININEKISRVVSKVGACTLGVYLIHGIIYTVLDDVLTGNGIVFTYSLAWVRTLIVFVIGTIIVYICRKIPLLKKLF